MQLALIVLAMSCPVVNIISGFFDGWFMWIVISDLAAAIVGMTFLYYDKRDFAPPLSFDFLGTVMPLTAYLRGLFGIAMFFALRHTLGMCYIFLTTVFIVYAMLLLRSGTFDSYVWAWRSYAMMFVVNVLVDVGYESVDFYLLLSMNEGLSAGKLFIMAIFYCLELNFMIQLSAFCVKVLWKTLETKPVEQDAQHLLIPIADI